MFGIFLDWPCMLCLLCDLLHFLVEKRNRFYLNQTCDQKLVSKRVF